MKRMFTVLVALLIVVSGMQSVRAEDDGDGPPDGPPAADEGHKHGAARERGGRGGHHRGNFANLSPECREKMKALRAEGKTKREAIVKEEKDPAARKTKFDALRTEMRERRRAILKECAPAPAASASPDGPPAPPPSPEPSPAPSAQ